MWGQAAWAAPRKQAKAVQPGQPPIHRLSHGVLTHVHQPIGLGYLLGRWAHFVGREVAPDQWQRVLMTKRGSDDRAVGEVLEGRPWGAAWRCSHAKQPRHNAVLSSSGAGSPPPPPGSAPCTACETAQSWPAATSSAQWVSCEWGRMSGCCSRRSGAGTPTGPSNHTSLRGSQPSRMSPCSHLERAQLLRRAGRVCCCSIELDVALLQAGAARSVHWGRVARKRPLQLP